MKQILIFSLLLFSTQIQGQLGFTFPETQVIFNKDVTFGTVHGYLEIESDTSDTLPIKWIARIQESMPSEWVVNFDDQTTFYPTIQSGNTDTFDLIPAQTFNRKLIIGLAHNGVADTASIFFSVFPVNSPNDSVIIEYQFRIARSGSNSDTTDTIGTGTSVYDLQKQNLRITAYRNDNWEVRTNRTVDQLIAYDMLGRQLGSIKNNNQLMVSTSEAAGLIIVQAIEEGHVTSQKFVACN